MISSFKMYDLIIIGAGPAGISAAYEAKTLGLDYLVIEKGLIGNTIYQYPVGLTVFSTTNELEFEPGDLKPAREKPTREELLSYYVRFVLDNELNIRTEEAVERVEAPDEFPAGTQRRKEKGFRVVVLPIFTKDGKRRLGTFLCEKKRRLTSRISTADDKRVLFYPRIRLTKIVVNFR